jgi:hypothetical protein
LKYIFIPGKSGLYRVLLVHQVSGKSKAAAPGPLSFLKRPQGAEHNSAAAAGENNQEERVIHQGAMTMLYLLSPTRKLVYT